MSDATTSTEPVDRDAPQPRARRALPVPRRAAAVAACRRGCAAALGLVAVACGATRGQPQLVAEFGTVVTLEAAIAAEPRKGGDVPFLLVRSIDGVALARPLAIAWTYGDHVAERSQPTGLGGFVVEPGRVYRLRGYETGSWRGVVSGVHPRLANGGFDDFGPALVQAPGFHFANEFRVLDGEALDLAADIAPDPHVRTAR